MAQVGVPPLLNAPSATPAAPAGTAPATPSASAWGIYLTGTAIPALTADSVVSIEFKGEWRISDYPQEQGAFQSYNKVTVPFDARVMLAKGGTEADRAAFLEALDSIATATNADGSLAVYDVVTPERTYIGASVQRYDYRRTSREGVGLIVADVWLSQVRTAAAAAFTNTAAASGQDKQAVGVVQPQSPTAAQSAQVGKPLSGASTGGATGYW